MPRLTPSHFSSHQVFPQRQLPREVLRQEAEAMYAFFASFASFASLALFPLLVKNTMPLRGIVSLRDKNSLNGLLRVVSRPERGYSFETICTKPGYRQQWRTFAYGRASLGDEVPAPHGKARLFLFPFAHHAIFTRVKCRSCGPDNGLTRAGSRSRKCAR